MAHTVQIQAVSKTGDAVTVTGVVDGGQPVTVTLWWANYLQPMTAAQRQQTAAQRLIAAVYPDGVPQDAGAGVTGTVTI